MGDARKIAGMIRLVGLFALSLLGFCGSLIYLGPMWWEYLHQRNWFFAPIWFAANWIFAVMRAQDDQTRIELAIPFITGLPGTILSYFYVQPGSERVYGVDVPTKRRIVLLEDEIRKLQSRANPNFANERRIALKKMINNIGEKELGHLIIARYHVVRSDPWFKEVLKTRASLGYDAVVEMLLSREISTMNP